MICQGTYHEKKLSISVLLFLFLKQVRGLRLLVTPTLLVPLISQSNKFAKQCLFPSIQRLKNQDSTVPDLIPICQLCMHNWIAGLKWQLDHTNKIKKKTLTTMGFIRVITTVIVIITLPRVCDTLAICAGKLIGFACLVTWRNCSFCSENSRVK